MRIPAKISFVLCLVLFSAFSSHAQEAVPVKTGDKLGFELLTHGSRGREIHVATATPVIAEIRVSSDSKILSYSTGRIVKLDKDSAVVEVTLRGLTNKFEGTRVFRWLPAERGIRNTYKVMFESTSSYAHCGEVRTEYNVTPKDAMFKVLIEGKEIEIKVIEYALDGRWMARCGSGKQTARMLYSPDLDLLVESEILNFQPDGFLNVGNGIRLKSIN